MSELSPDQRAQRWGTVAKWAAFAVGGFLFAPFAVATITGMVGLIVAAAIAGTTWYLMPVFEQKAKNLRLKMIKAEAAKNPVETLEAEELRRSTMLDDRLKAIQTFEAKTRTFEDKLVGFKKQYPSEADRYQRDLDNMKLVLERQKAQWKEARRNLEAFHHVVEKAKAMWDMAQAAAAAREGTGLDEDSFYAQLKTATALDAVQDGMNMAFSQLDTLVLEGDAQELPGPADQKALPSDSRPVVDVTPTTKTRAQ